MRFSFENLIHWRRNLNWQEKGKVILCEQGGLPLSPIKMQVLSPCVVLEVLLPCIFLEVLLPKSEIECIVVKMLEVGIIQPSQNSSSTLVVLAQKKDGSWHVCLDYRELNKLSIKYKFPIPIIDELLDELHRSIYFT